MSQALVAHGASWVTALSGLLPDGARGLRASGLCQPGVSREQPKGRDEGLWLGVGLHGPCGSFQLRVFHGFMVCGSHVPSAQGRHDGVDPGRDGKDRRCPGGPTATNSAPAVLDLIPSVPFHCTSQSFWHGGMGRVVLLGEIRQQKPSSPKNIITTAPGGHSSSRAATRARLTRSPVGSGVAFSAQV